MRWGVAPARGSAKRSCRWKFSDCTAAPIVSTRFCKVWISDIGGYLFPAWRSTRNVDSLTMCSLRVCVRRL